MTKKRIIRSDRFRLCVYRSAKHIYAQVIDDARGITLCSASSLGVAPVQPSSDSPSGEAMRLSGKVHKAGKVGREIAQRAKECGITRVFFDRNGYKYHGRVRQLAESARSEGLDF